jgi:hypothetical protein
MDGAPPMNGKIYNRHIDIAYYAEYGAESGPLGAVIGS